jgi:hypothetical protein
VNFAPTSLDDIDAAFMTMANGSGVITETNEVVSQEQASVTAGISRRSKIRCTYRDNPCSGLVRR